MSRIFRKFCLTLSLCPLRHILHNPRLISTAWNDNGKGSLVQDPHRLYRSDFFGGLGWMLRRELWMEEVGVVVEGRS
jgi:hypothetical protein